MKMCLAQRTRWFALALAAVVGFAASPNAARADFMLYNPPENSITLSQKLFLDNSTHNATFTGVVGDQTVGPLVNITPNLFPVKVGNGWSTIKASTGNLTSILFVPVDSHLFTDFSTRGQLAAAGNVTITVTDNNSQSFTFSEPKNSDWDRVGVIAIAGSGEFIESVLVSTDAGNLNELKQIAFSVEPSIRTPEFGSVTLMGIMLLGFGGITGFRRLRKPAA